jgi:hypothetical protein
LLLLTTLPIWEKNEVAKVVSVEKEGCSRNILEVPNVTLEEKKI